MVVKLQDCEILEEDLLRRIRDIETAHICHDRTEIRKLEFKLLTWKVTFFATLSFVVLMLLLTK